MTWTVLEGDARIELPTLAAKSVQCVVTSPPYWGLRDYGVDGQLGLESTPEEYVANLVNVFREIRRVLRGDGTVWLVLGDSYNAAGRVGHGTRVGFKQGTNRASANGSDHTRPSDAGLKEKDLVGIPWRVAFALQADGWWLRSDIIWAKPNPMPESVTDRPTKAHEYVFLLSKNARYFYDADAVREEAIKGASGSTFMNGKTGINGLGRVSRAERIESAYRNLRSVWNIATEPFPEAHFATFPKKLVEPCIKAGTSEKGCCPACGAPWVREVKAGTPAPEPDRSPPKRLEPGQAGNVGAGNMGFRASRLSGQEMAAWKASHPDVTTGWQPTCIHEAFDPVPCTVLDPFAGSGTTGIVALRLGRSFVGIELNPEYVEMARRRIENDAPLFNMEGVRDG